ncbi:MAG: DUF4160 domain-containing protein [Verrucomicrobiales bacterium]|jgi:hypothetical protein|nr:DUF4160 domain-containing protein [Verrucomicrobiales bacterium]
MPAISMFYGIVIYMYYNDVQQHHLPHIHAIYQGEEAVMAIENGDVLAGGMNARKLRMVQTWVDMRREDLLTDWELAKTGKEPVNIEPLR